MEGTLRDEIKKLNRNFESMSKEKQKKFKLPMRARVGKKAVKEGFASICYINENRHIKFMKAPIKEGTIMVNDTPYVASTDYMLTYRNKPFLIVPSWNIEPFAPAKNFEEAAKNKTSSIGYRLIMNRMKSEQIKPKGKFSGGLILILIAGAAAAAYFIFRGKIG